jgi:hypothetical protein
VAGRATAKARVTVAWVATLLGGCATPEVVRQIAEARPDAEYEATMHGCGSTVPTARRSPDGAAARQAAGGEASEILVERPCPMSIQTEAVRIEGEQPARHRKSPQEEHPMKQYLLSIYQPDGDPPPPEILEPIMRDINAVTREMKAAGVWVFNGGLHAASTATVVRLRDGKVLTTDGPYIEGKEHIGGFTIIKASDLDAALGWAGKLARAVALLPIEVRPFQGEG